MVLKGYKSEDELIQFKQSELFTLQKGDIVEFYYVPLQNLEFLAKISFKHLLIVIKSKSQQKFMSIGFYPGDGDILGALINPKDGYIWSPDPHYTPNDPEFKPAYYYNTINPIIYTLNANQANLFNNIFNQSYPACKLKDGSLSRGKIKRDRIECIINQYKYCPIQGIKSNYKNCITWLYQVFPDLNIDINGKHNNILPIILLLILLIFIIAFFIRRVKFKKYPTRSKIKYHRN